MSLAGPNIAQLEVKTGLSIPVKKFTDCSKAVLLLCIFHVISAVCFLCFWVRLFIVALWSPAGKELASWLSFVMSNSKIGILGQVWYLTVSSPNLCPLSYYL